MKNFKILPISFLALMTVMGGLTVATAQSTTDKTPAASEQAKPMKAKFGKHHGHQGGRAMIGTILKKADTDGDRAVTQTEIDTLRSELVTTADASGEGDLSLDEFQAIYLEMIRAQMVDAFQSIDEDGNGAVTPAEMDARFGSIVERMDRNDDGKLDRNDRPKRDRQG